MFAANDPTDELGAASGVKDHLRVLLRVGSLAEAHEAKMRRGLTVIAADMPKTYRATTHGVVVKPRIEQ